VRPTPSSAAACTSSRTAGSGTAGSSADGRRDVTRRAGGDDVDVDEAVGSAIRFASWVGKPFTYLWVSSSSPKSLCGCGQPPTVPSAKRIARVAPGSRTAAKAPRLPRLNVLPSPLAVTPAVVPAAVSADSPV
jgi:hypothetical protein